MKESLKDFTCDAIYQMHSVQDVHALYMEIKMMLRFIMVTKMQQGFPQILSLFVEVGAEHVCVCALDGGTCTLLK